MPKGGSTMGSNAAVAEDFAVRGLECNKESGSMWCSKGTVFSYDTPIATYVIDPRGVKCVLLTERNYSPSTSKHQLLVRQFVDAESHDVIVTPDKLRHPISWDELEFTDTRVRVK
jgi:hypothetical protein